MAEANQQKHGFYGWTNLAILFVIYGAIYGFIFYGFTVIFPEMIKAQSWGRGEASVAHTLRAFSLGAFAPLVAIVLGKFGSKRTMMFGIFLGIVVMGALGTVTSELWHWIVLWGVIMPISFSFGGYLPIQTSLTYWFNIKRGMAMGIVVTASAFAGFVAAPLFTYIMQQTGTWKTGWLTAGGFCTLALIVNFFAIDKPSDVGQFPDGIDPEIAVKTNDPVKKKVAKTYRTDEPWSLKEVLRKPTIYFLAICMISQGSAIYLLTTHGVLHLTDVGLTRMQAASLIGNMILFSGFARFPMGFLGDRIEPRRIFTIALAGMAISSFGIWKAPDNYTVLLVIASAFGFCFGAMVPLFPAILGNYFGPDAFAPINGFISPFMVAFSAPVPFVAGIIYDKFQNYDIAFIYIVVILLISTLCSFALVPPKKT